MKRYTLHHGDTLAILPTMETASIDAIFADPPYSSGGAFRSDRSLNTVSKYQTTDTKKEYPDFAGDNRDQLAYYYWSALWMGECSRVLKPGRVFCVFTDWRQLATTITAFQVGGFVWRGVVPWNKTEAARPTKGRYRAQCEYVVWGTNGPMDEQTEECMPGFFTYPVRPTDKKHVTAKPLSLMVDLLKIAAPDSLILDPFMGSGTTGLAAMQSGHRFIGIEKDEKIYRIAEAEISQAAKQTVFTMAASAEAYLQPSMNLGD